MTTTSDAKLTIDDALWQAYFANRSDANRNAIFEREWDWIQEAAIRKIASMKLDRWRDELLSDIATRLLEAMPDFRLSLCVPWSVFVRARIRWGIKGFLRILANQRRWEGGNKSIDRIYDDDLDDFADYRQQHGLEERFSELTEGLSEVHRKALWSYYYDGYNETEVGTLLGLMQPRAHKILREAIQEIKNPSVV